MGLDIIIKNTCILTLLVLSGCVAMQPFPHTFRAGDTIVLPVGSADNMTKTNTTVNFISDADSTGGVGVDLTPNIVEIFKIYPDKTSYVWQESLATATSRRSSHGPWLSLISINLPIGLDLGPGTINVTTTSEVTYPLLNPRVDDVSIAVNVLPTDGSPNPLWYKDLTGTAVGNLADMIPLPQAVVKPQRPFSGETFTPYGAIEIKLNVPIRKFSGDPVGNGRVSVVMDDQMDHINSQLQMSWSRVGDEFTINLVSPIGMLYHEARVSIVPFYLHTITAPPSFVSITYYDLNGNIVSGPTPSVSMLII